MRKGWLTKKLGEMLEVQNGYAFDSKGFNQTKGMPLIRIRSLKSGTEAETRFDGDYDKKYVVKAGDLLIGMDGEFGCYEWKGEPALLNQRVCRLQGFSGELLSQFLFYGVNDYLKAIEEVTGYATVKHLSSKQILSIDFPVPPLAEQRRIVNILDEAFDGIATAEANAERNLQSARAVFESELDAIFFKRGRGWVGTKIEKAVQANCSLSYGIVQPGVECDNGLPIVRPTDLTRKLIRLEGLKRIEPKLASGYGRTTLQGGELLLCVRGSTGVVGIAAAELAGGNVTRGIVPIRFNEELVTREFGYYLMLCPDVQRQIRAKTYGAALMQINIGDLREITLSYPPLKEQKEFAAKLDSLSEATQRLESVYQRKADALQTLRKSLLHEAFTGQLTAAR